ncbi:hypothetical protein ACGFRG_12875 [Streptomyces sp. NPDC048696]|uniref:hypothetical protein n=1 Tax=Streptomyces sp. NPDC048696 TaxID=3365585 RepID=UPI00371727DE
MPVPAPRLAQDAFEDTPPGGSPRVARTPHAPGAPAPAGGPPRRADGAHNGARGVRAPISGTGDSAGDVVRWAAFSCVLAPVLLVVYGGSFGGAAGSALGLTAVTAACRLLLRRSERAAARARAERAAAAPHGTPGTRARQERTGAGAHRGARRNGESSPLD